MIPNRTSNGTSDSMMTALSPSECIAWIAVYGVESVVIVTLNIFTIVVFAKSPDVRKNSTYLLINLAVADMFVGGLTVSYTLSDLVRACAFWNYDDNDLGQYLVPVYILFPVASIIDLVIISFERLHVTLCPFSHRVVRKWVYGVTIFISWLTSALIANVIAVIHNYIQSPSAYFIAWSSFVLFSVSLICASYVAIFIKIRCGQHLQHHGTTQRERKLTVTLFIVAAVSLLTCLPFTALTIFAQENKRTILKLSSSTRLHMGSVTAILYYANSLVNPILYTIRMPEFKRAAYRQLSCKIVQRRRAPVFPLHDM